MLERIVDYMRTLFGTDKNGNVRKSGRTAETGTEKAEEEQKKLKDEIIRGIAYDTKCKIEFMEALEIRNSYNEKRDLGKVRILPGNLTIDSLYEFCSGERTDLGKLYPEGGSDCKVSTYRHERYGQILEISKSIPTFDVYDRQSDSYHDVYFLSDGKDIYLLYVKGGYSIAWIGIGIKIRAADKNLWEKLQEMHFPMDNVRVI